LFLLPSDMGNKAMKPLGWLEVMAEDNAKFYFLN
jgi:hypothetical protein